MAHDEELANQVRELLGGETGLEEKRMFGGIGFMVAGNLAVAASGQGGLLVRVDRSGLGDTRALETWVERGTGRARALASQ